MTLIGKVLPMQVTGDSERPIAVDFRWADALPAALPAPKPEPPALESEASDAAEANVDFRWAAE